MRRYILAIDPGKKTGWAAYDREMDTFVSGELDYDDTCKLLLHPESIFNGPLSAMEFDYACESFIITVNTAKNTQATWSLELIGVARMISRLYGGQELVLQTPAAAKRLMSDDLLKALSWYVPGKGHSNDAARHLGLFMLSRGWMDDRIKQFIAGR